jgi:hypothetical protein
MQIGVKKFSQPVWQNSSRTPLRKELTNVDRWLRSTLTGEKGSAAIRFAQDLVIV